MKQEQNYTQEGIVEEQKLLELTMSDDDLVKQVNKDMQNAMPLFQQMKGIQKENESYYLGQQMDKKRFKWELPSAENLLYMATETIMSIITAKRREPIVMATRQEDDSKELASKTQQFLAWKWNEQDMMIKFEDWVRHAFLYRIGILKIRFDIEKDDFEIENILPQKIMIDKNATDEYNAKFIIEFRQDTLVDLITLYPIAKKKLIESYGDQMGTLINYVEYWTNEFTVIKVNKIVLDKKKNPNWNWDETDRKESLEKLKKKWIEKTKDEKLENILLNYFNEPRKPYITLSLKNLGKSIYSDTSDFDQGKIIQDIINRRKRQIDKAGVRALGREVFSGSFISEEEAKKTLSNPTSPLWIKNGKASDAITHVAPQPVSPVLFDDLQESKQALDNILGTHGTTRGEQGPQETARGRTILREGDFGRIDLMARRVDKKLELLYGWMMQMSKVYYNENHFMKMLGEDGATNYLEFSSDDIEDGQEIIVKSELTVDKATQRENAVKRLEMQMSDPLSLMEDLDTANPKEKARRLVMYNVDPKLYLQEFCVDADTEGADNNPTMKARQEQEAIMQGEQVPPFEGADKEHIQEHGKFIKSSEFSKSEDIEMKQNFQNHLQQEVEIVRKNTQV